MPKMPNDKNIPKRVQMGPYWFDVVVTHEETENNRYGSTTYNTKTEIALSPNNTPQQHLATFIHEVLHAAANTYRVKDKEDDIARLANGVTQALQSCGLLPDGLVDPNGK